LGFRVYQVLGLHLLDAEEDWTTSPMGDLL
jgi:hypothetical protein